MCRIEKVHEWSIFFFFHVSVGAQLLQEVTNKSTCIGKNVSLDWRYNENTTHEVLWKKGSDVFMFKIALQNIMLTDIAQNMTFEYNQVGGVKLINVSMADTGLYGIALEYTIPENKTDTKNDKAFVQVKASPSEIKNTSTESQSGTQYTCFVDQFGEPPVTVKIQIGETIMEQATYTVDLSEPVYCCIVGKAVECMVASSDSDSGIYCKPIHIPYGPKDVGLTPAQAVYTLQKGDTFGNISCSADCNPPCIYSWFKDSVSISGSSVLPSLHIEGKQDKGTYTCTATRRHNHSQSTNITVFVIYGPDTLWFNTSDPEYVKNEGEPLSDIICVADCYPGCSYFWKKDKSNVSNNDKLSLGSLYRNESGVYTCTATNIKTNQLSNNSLTVHVIYGPDYVDFSPSDSEYIKDEGESLPEITCKADCYPYCSYSWKKDQVTILDRDINSDTLSLDKLYRNESGLYSCTAVNSRTQNKSEKNITLVVNYFPDLSVSLTKGSDLIDDGNVTMLCTADAKPANFSYFKWIHIAPDNKTQIHTFDGIKSGNQNRLSLHNLSYMDSGIYICNVSNTVKDYRTSSLHATENVTFTEKGEPQIVTQSSQYYAAIDSNVELKISFYSNDNTSPVAQWFKVDNETKKEITNTSARHSFEILESFVTVLFYTENITLAGYTSQLTISDLKPLDIGNYELYIKNSVGHNSTTLVVLAAGPPEKPKDFKTIMDIATESSITVTWYSGFHGGGNQTFHIEFRKKGSAEWQYGLSVYGGQIEDKAFIAAVDSLSADTAYEFQIYSENRFNQSDVAKTDGNTTSVEQAVIQTKSFPTGAVVGGCLGAAALTIIIVILVIWKRRLNSKLTGDDSKTTILTPKRHTGVRDHDETAEINLNPMYESSDTAYPKTANTDVYATVNKNASQPDPGKASDVYSVVHKTSDKNAKSSRNKKRKKAGVKTNVETSRQKDGMVYENAESSSSKLKNVDNVYENPVCSSSDEKPYRTKNDEGLIYIEVELPQQKDAQNKQPVIHGEDKTIYADVAYGQVGEPKPASDDEI